MVKARHDRTVVVAGVARRNRPALMMTTALQATFMLVLSLPADAQPLSNAHPTGWSVVAGSAAVSQTNSNTRIDQSTQRAAIDWRSFDVGSQQSVTFNQPSTSAVALNRVSGPDPSQIAGHIDANGQIILVNQSGVNFYKGAQVNAAGVMVSTVGVSDQNVKSFVGSNTGRLALDQPGNPNARIDNAGNITIKQMGLATMVAPQVANSGTITAKLGHVVLAGAKTATLDLYGDGLLSLDVTNQVTQRPVDKDGNSATALVTNTGVIIADGGTVQLTARAADGIVQTLVQAGGTIRAATVGDRTGVVALNGVGGSIVVEGQLAAPGNAVGTKGGAIEVVSSHDVVLASGARIGASGPAGGGVVAVGTTLARAKGGPNVTPALTAKNVTVRQGATIAADATANGDGGRVTVLSADTTRMDGLIRARAGAPGGNGGFVEVSGVKLGMDTGSIDVSAPAGNFGTILLDPRDLEIIGTGTGNGNVIATGVPVGSPDQNTDITVSASALTALSGNLLIEASRNLTVDAALAFKNQTGNTVSLLAGNNLTVNQPVSTTLGSLTLSAAVQTDGTTQFAHFNPAGALTINANVGATDTVTLSAGSGGISLGANVAAKTLDLSTSGGGNVSQTGSAIHVTTLTSSNGVTGSVSLIGANNTLTNVDGVAVSGGNLVLVSAIDLTLLNTISGNSLFFEVNSGEGTLTLGTPSTFAPGTKATLVGKSGHISLVADTISVGNKASTVTAGTVELSPFSVINIGLPNGIFIDSTLLTLIQTNGGTLGVGGFTDVPTGAMTPTPRAGAISINGTVNLLTTASTLRLDATAEITQSPTAGLLEVARLTGTASSVTIDNPNNLISSLGNFTTSGNLTLKTAVPLIVDGTVKAGGVTAPDPANSAKVALTAFGGLQIGAGTAGSINAGTVTLTANSGSITEPSGAIGANSFSATATATEGGGSNVLLTSSSNKIELSTGITAAGGNIALVDDPPLVLTGLHQGNNLFFEVIQHGGSLVLGDAKTPATLNATTGNLISLVADNITTGNPNSSITVPFGTVELAPFSPINESVVGTSNSGQLLIGETLLSIVNAGKVGPLDTLVIGGFTNQPANAATPGASASGVTIDGPLDLSTRTFTLNLLSKGTVTEPGGPLTVSDVIGSAVGTFSLANPNNAINESFGISATNGDVILVDKSDLLLAGPQSGNNLFDEVARPGGVLHLGSEGPVSLTAGTGGRISLVADTISPSGADSVISVPGGTLELAPFSAIDTSMNGTIAAGQLLIDAGLLSLVSPAINTLVIGGFTNVPVGATTSSPSAASVTIDGTVDLAPLATTLDLEAIGPVTQSAPILNVGTLLGTTGSTTLTNPANTIAILGNYTATSGFALTNARDLLVAGAVTTAGNAAFTITGALTETGSLTANQLSGSATGAASLTGTNKVASLGDFSASSFALNDSVDLLLAGTLNAANIAIRNPGNQITLGDGSTIITGGTTRPSGPLQPPLEPANGGAGALLRSASFTQVGSSTVLGQGGGPATLQISVTGNMQFDPPLGLQATGTWLILDLTNGTATGSVFVNALDVTYTTPGSTNLFGTIAGVTGGPAAAVGNIQPAVNTSYLFNNCVIASPVCQPSPPTTTPTPIPTPTPTPTLVFNTGTLFTTLPTVAITSTLGGIFEAIAPPLPSLASLPTVILLALPMLQPQPPQLTDPDVVPPNITYLDY